MTRYFVVREEDEHDNTNRRQKGLVRNALPTRYTDRPTLKWADSLPKARLKAVSYLKTTDPKGRVAIVKEGEKVYREGIVYLNWRGTGVWQEGRWAWMINSKDGSIYDKSYSW